MQDNNTLCLHDAYWFITNHPEFCKRDPKRDRPTIDVYITKINPFTLERDDVLELNTLTQVWLELYYFDPEINLKVQCHDWDLDTGGSTYEEAIIKLASLVKEHYGSYEERL